MRKLLLATVALAAMTTASNAAIFELVTPDPSSATGNFSLSPGGGPFDDQITFTITQASTFTIANATNTYASPADAIVDWQASIWDSVDGVLKNGNDVLLFGPQGGGACVGVPLCQTVGGSGFLNGRSLFYADFTGIGSGTSGYSGNISTVAAVPEPSTWAMMILGFACVGWFGMRKRHEIPFRLV